MICIPVSRSTFYIPNNYYCSKGKDDKVCNESPKKEESTIKSHPGSKNADKLPEDSAKLKLKECKPVNLDPCKPPPIGYPSVKSLIITILKNIFQQDVLT